MNDNSPDFWQERYDAQQTPWDLGRPTPVFERLAREGWFAPGKMIVLGAGSGYDAHLFARYGFVVTAVDFAAAAVEKIRSMNNPAHPVTAVQSDIFDLPANMNGQFDYILEYTCYCAIPPEQRDEYGRLANRLLKPDGLWIALSFPIGKRAGGPPYVVQPDHVVERMSEHGFSLIHREMPPDSDEERQGIEELLIMKKVAVLDED